MGTDAGAHFAELQWGGVGDSLPRGASKEDKRIVGGHNLGCLGRHRDAKRNARGEERQRWVGWHGPVRGAESAAAAGSPTRIRS